MAANRKSTRLKGYDYSLNGGYFITICTHNRINFFGSIENSEMKLNECGRIIQETWFTLPQYFTDILLDEFVIMPNHFHGIFLISHCRGLINQTPTINQISPDNNKKWILMKNVNKPLGKIIRNFKAKSSYTLHKKGYNDFKWQRNYYKHIIRNDNDLPEPANILIIIC